jgi:hypothetical protein
MQRIAADLLSGDRRSSLIWRQEVVANLSSKERWFGSRSFLSWDGRRPNGQGEAIILALPPNSAANSHSCVLTRPIDRTPAPDRSSAVTEPQLMAEIRTRKMASTKKLRRPCKTSLCTCPKREQNYTPCFASTLKWRLNCSSRAAPG